MKTNPWQVHETVSWHIAGGQIEAPPKAHFFWKRGNAVCRAAEFGILELQAEIERLEEARRDASEHRKALECLAASRRPAGRASGRRAYA